MKLRHSQSAFTLIELLVVLAIVGVLAALVAPGISNVRRGDLTAAATRQLVDDIARARQFAITHRTTVYMVFVPTNFWDDPGYRNNGQLTPADRVAATNLAELQMVGYNFVSLRSIGEQPGRRTPRYLSEWRSLPEGTFIALEKFTTPPIAANAPTLIPATAIPDDPMTPYRIFGFQRSNEIPFPRADTRGTFPQLPFIKFDHTGRLTSERIAGQSGEAFFDAIIPLAHGSVAINRDHTTKQPSLAPPAEGTPSVAENPPNNSREAYNLIYVDQLTGRARHIRREIR